ncbi:Speckle-type POZ protein [Orchesella cincta]|uniref:Speckle-type POZ protein n=1 Tax=Orchesella cincta TaxID=48709 RepID=A0A1D2MSZ1_ORCCI|nr:Speckle-type POZ protein [Orchesella cincta]
MLSVPAVQFFSLKFFVFAKKNVVIDLEYFFYTLCSDELIAFLVILWIGYRVCESRLNILEVISYRNMERVRLPFVVSRRELMRIPDCDNRDQVVEGRGAAAVANLEPVDSPYMNADILGTTTIECEPFTFLWTLNDYSKLSALGEIWSALFYGDSKNNHAWQLKVVPKQRASPEEGECLGVYLCLKEFGSGENTYYRKIRARYQIGLLDPDGKMSTSRGYRSMNAVEVMKNALWGWDKFISLGELHSPYRRLVVNDVLRIHCTVWIEGQITQSLTVKGRGVALTKEEKVLKNRTILAEEFGNMFKNSVGTDFEILVDTPGGDQAVDVIRVHKAVLAARSSKMANSFAIGMYKDNRMTITTFNRTTVSGMLEYLYTGSVDQAVMNEAAPDILQISEMFDLPELKEECAFQISNHIEIQNASEVLLLAHLYNTDWLKAQAVAFINKHKEAVMKTQSFREVLTRHRSSGIFADLFVADGV